MASTVQIKARVLAYFRGRWPHANENTDLRDDLLLDDRQILDIGTELAEELNCYPTRNQILKCKTIGELIKLLIETRSGAAPKGAFEAKSSPVAKRRAEKKSQSKRRAVPARKKKSR